MSTLTHSYAIRGNHHNLYDRWTNIKARCYNKNNQAYKWYGGRGITMFPDWIGNPKLFIEYCLSIGYKPELTIDREDNDKGYFPGNIRFVTTVINNLNRSHIVMPEKTCKNIWRISADNI